MTPQTREYVRYRLERASQSLEAATASMERGLFNDAVNRIYYACFYAVSALLLSKGLSSAKHTGVRSLFEQHFVKNGPLPKELGRFYHRLFRMRQDSDYTDLVSFAKGDIEARLQQAREFVAQVARQIEDQP